MISKLKQVVVYSTHVMILVWIVALSVCLLRIPTYFRWNVVRQPAYKFLPHLYDENSTETVYWHSPPTDGPSGEIYVLILALCFRILPGLISIVVSILLILNILHARQLRKHLHRRYSFVSSSTSSFKRQLRTAKIVVFITLFSVLQDFSQVLLYIAIRVDKNRIVLYLQLAGILDITSVGTSLIRFIIYYILAEIPDDDWEN
jgi:hypothetical protein